MSGGWRVQAQYEAYEDGYSVLVRRGESVVRLSLEPHEPGELLSPTIEASRDGGGEPFLRAALNCAWEMGLRPDGFNDTREGMAATKAHLEDMRTLAFHKLGAAKP